MVAMFCTTVEHYYYILIFEFHKAYWTIATLIKKKATKVLLVLVHEFLLIFFHVPEVVLGQLPSSPSNRLSILSLTSGKLTID